MNNIEKAMQVALNAHNSQTDKAGEPYIKHPIRVMQSVESEEEKVVALLHDVVEDSTVSFEDLERRFSDEIVDAVRGMTKKSDESYSEFIERAKENEISREVKKADIQDNLDLERLDEITEEDLERARKYRKSLRQLSVKNREIGSSVELDEDQREFSKEFGKNMKNKKHVDVERGVVSDE